MFRGKAACVVVGLMLVTAMAQVASAQPRARRGGGGGGFGFGMSSVALATLDQVQDDLKMTDEQEAKVADIESKLRTERRDLFQQRPENMAEMREKMEKLNADAAGKLSGVLDKDQLKRLAGTVIRVNGAMALNDPVVDDQLNLSDEQKTKLNDIRAEHWRAIGEAMSQNENMSRQERREKMSELREKAGKDLTAVLTPDQQKTFDQLKAEGIEVDMSQFRGRGRQGG
jgi:Spy/CpxP family protein refolding chaperone